MTHLTASATHTILTTRYGPSCWDITVIGSDAPFRKVSWLNRPSLSDCLRHAKTLGVSVDLLTRHASTMHMSQEENAAKETIQA